MANKAGIDGKRVALLLLWAVVLAAGAVLYARLDIPLAQAPGMMKAWIETTGPWGPLLFVAAYTVRPLTLLPATIPTVAAGLLWGPAYGLLFTLIGENLSASFAFCLARWLGRDWLIGFHDHPILKRVDRHLMEDGIITVLLMRLVFVPFDLTNFACGLTKMRYTDYAIGTAIGILPGAAIFVLFGSAWSEPRNLAISAVLFAGSLLVARLVKRSRLGHRLLEAEEPA
jgi:uncharacterized membrane protein YdjX (TVP38/TMEM64 family)